MKRPLLWGFMALCIGLAAVFYGVPVWMIIGSGLLVMPLAFKKVKLSQMFFVMGMLVLAVFFGRASFPKADILESDYEKEVSIIGVVTDYPVQQDDRLSIDLEVKEFVDASKNRLEKPVGIKATVYFDKGKSKKSDDANVPLTNVDYAPGNVLKIKGKLTEPVGRRNPGGFDYALYLKSQSIDVLMSTSLNQIEKVGQKNSLYYHILGIKKYFEDICDASFSKDVSDLLKGVIFGEKDIGVDLSQSFRDAGITHVLSVSGLHVSYVFLVLLVLLKAIRLKKQYWPLFLLPALFFYVALTGFVAPVVRAAIMLFCLTLGQGIHRERDALNQLCLAGIVILCIWPAQLFQAGFQLSMSAILGIILFYRPLIYGYEKKCGVQKGNKKTEAGIIVQGLVLTFCATVGTMPFLLYHFKRLTLMSFFSNLLVVPLIGFLLIAGMLFLVVVSIFPFLKVVLALPITFLGESIIVMLDGINDIGARMPFLWITRGALSIAEMGLFLLFIFFISGYFYLKKKAVRNVTLGIGIICLLVLFVSPLIPRDLKITVLDVGQGESLLIETPGGLNYLVDGGGYIFERTTKVSENVLYPVLYSKNIQQLDAIFLTHNHVDHGQGIEELIADGYPVKNLFMSVQTNQQDLLDQSVIPVTLLKKDSIIEGKDGLRIKIISPDGKVSPKGDSEQNNTSLVMAVSYKNSHILLCGDIEAEAERKIVKELETENLDFQVLKIPHHGSKTSSTLPFIRAVDPEIAVISVGKNNIYRHPSEEVLTRLEKEGILTVRTDEKGAIEIISDGKSVRVKSIID